MSYLRAACSRGVSAASGWIDTPRRRRGWETCVFIKAHSWGWSLRVRPRAYVAIAVFPALAVGLVGAAEASDSHQARPLAEFHLYAAQHANELAHGVDGYIRKSTTVPLTADQGSVNFISVSPNSSEWVQTGQMQGTVWNGSGDSSTTVTEYWERNIPDCGYKMTHLGTRSHLNEAYCITIGLTAVSHPCANPARMYPIYVRIGSWTSPPVGSTYSIYQFHYAQATTEAGFLGDGDEFPPLGRDQFGLNDTGGVNDGYGLHLYSGTSWILWSTSISTFVNEDQPPHYSAAKKWSAFFTYD